MAIVMFSFAGSANTINPSNEIKTESASITIQTKDAKTVYTFNSVDDFKNHTNQIIDSVNSLPVEEACTVTISMTVSVTVSASIGVAGGEVTTTVTGSITASCDGAVSAGKRLRASLIAMAQG